MLLPLILVFLFSASTLAEIRVSLNSNDNAKWTLVNQNKSLTVSGSVPGGVYTDLQAAGVLDQNLFYRLNDIDYRWVAKDNWTYSTAFDLSGEILNKTKVNLVLHGVDTVGEVYLNGALLGSVENMFVRYIFSIKSIARAANNQLEIRLISPISASAVRAAAHPYVVPPECVPDAYNGECHANMLRKMQASFSWDFGPAFPSVGVWKDVEVEAFDLGVVRDILVIPEKVMIENITSWRLTVTLFSDLATESFHDVLIVQISLQDKILIPHSHRSFNFTNGNYSMINNEEFIFDASEVKEWWPNGYGDQPLYGVNVTLFSQNEQANLFRKTAFRTVELVQEPLKLTTAGLSFYFKVNGVPIFAKGSNWIPGNVLPEVGSRSEIMTRALTAAAKAHMNMLRVWGGGVYESDEFYELTDSLGILVWQDMMFACAMYPVDDKFISSVRTEVEQQVRRLQIHPSIAIWAGNNENEAALRSNWYGTNNNFNLYKDDYITLYVETIKSIVEAHDESRRYVASSPSNGDFSEEQGFVADDPYSPLYGDLHYYNYVSDGWDSSTFPNTRFASEYGFQSLPSFYSIASVSESTDWSISSQFSQMRQHHPNGYTEMTALIKKRLPLPDDDGSLNYFRTYIYYSQIYQAVAIKTETEKYRRDRSKLTESNEGNTHGALYWQLNDMWIAPTWASIESDGRWKMLHYYAVKFFAPILISPEVAVNGDISLYIISDLMEDKPGIVMDQRVFSYGSLTPRYTSTINATAVKGSSSLALTTTSTSLLNAAQCNSSAECFFHFQLRDPADGDNIISENVYFPTPLQNARLSAANITVTVPIECGIGCVAIDITTNTVAPFLWLETNVTGVFSDNGFTMIEPYRRIEFQSSGDLDILTFFNSLTVRALGSNIVSPLPPIPITYQVVLANN